jgi:hypothetical protein
MTDSTPEMPPEVQYYGCLPRKSGYFKLQILECSTSGPASALTHLAANLLSSHIVSGDPS